MRESNVSGSVFNFLVEIMSASNFEGIKTRKKRLYQPDNRKYGSQNLVYPEDCEDDDNAKFEELSSQLEKVKLKKTIFENKRVSDYHQV